MKKKETHSPLPCPFCGNRQVEVLPSYWVECECGARVSGESFRYTEKQHAKARESAIAAWNRRVNEGPSVDAKLKATERLAKAARLVSQWTRDEDKAWKVNRDLVVALAAWYRAQEKK